MSINLVPLARRALDHHPSIKHALIEADQYVNLAHQTAAQAFPFVIRPTNRFMTVAITSHCNLRCLGCRYGRDFMPGTQLPLVKLEELLDDAAACGVHTVRLYGGEPLLHPDLPAMISRCLHNQMRPYITTNGTLLERRVDELYEAGLRSVTIGFYGTGEYYDRYVQRKDRFAELERGLNYVRTTYGSRIEVQINFLLMRQTCNPEALRRAWEFAERFDTEFRVDLIHRALPYFTEGPNRMLQFTAEDRPQLELLTQSLLALRQLHPDRYKEPSASIRAIPDWLLRGAGMRVPCNAHDLIWVGADGSVQLCYAAFPLGNLYTSRLKDVLRTPAHVRAAQQAFRLECPNCCCKRESRIRTHWPSLMRYL